MKVTVCFDNVRVVVPCGDGTLLVRDLMHESTLRYRKATGKTDTPTIVSLSTLTGGGGLLDPDDRLCDVADDREQIVAHFGNEAGNHVGGDGASSVGTNSPDFFPSEHGRERRYANDVRARLSGGNMKRESVKRLSMHALSTREPALTGYSALSLPRESRRREPLGQDSKVGHEFPSPPRSAGFPELGGGQLREIVVKNEPGVLGLHVVPCYDLGGNDQGLRVEGIEPNGRIAKDGQIDIHDRIIKINGHSLLRIPFSKVQSIFASCMSDPCLRISLLKHEGRSETAAKSEDSNRAEKPRKSRDSRSGPEVNSSMEKSDPDQDTQKKLQCYNILQSSNTRKIGRMIEIDLVKGLNGLGFSVTTRDNPAGGHCPIYIKNILPKGAAVEDGRLRPGDRLLEVNKIEMTGMSQSEVVSHLRSIPSGGKVRMIVSRQEEVSNGPEGSPPRVSESTPDHARPWNPIGPVGALRASKINYNSPDKTYEKVLPYKIVDASEEPIVSPRKNRIILTLDIPVHDSEKAGLGVSVKGKTSSADENTNMDLGIFIKSVLNGGAASRDGRLRTNDQLLNVNGVSLLGLSNSEAMETLRRAMLNTNSSITGVITLTIARRASSSYDAEKSFSETATPSTTAPNTPGMKIDPSNGIYSTDSGKHPGEGRQRDKNHLNADSHEGLKILSSGTSPSPWNPVIDRLTEQYNKNSLRNESYCLATNKNWLSSVSNAKRLMLGADDIADLLQEESQLQASREIAKSSERHEENSQYSSGDPTYDSQLSLEEVSDHSNKFSRDALGRQSMSEKRHAALDAKNTDTYKRNKKLRDERQEKNCDEGASQQPREDKILQEKSSSAGAILTSNPNKNESHRSADYRYTISGEKFLSPRKHWLVDDIPANDLSPNSQGHKDEHEGFTNSRGDVKQSSLNALDERYKRSRKKGGIRSMLRLGKNRKSLNFGDSIDNRHESSNYCSGTINYIA